MTTLALQIFLLLLSAFLVGCLLGCLLRRLFHTSQDRAERTVVPATPEPVRTVQPPPPEAARFGRALTGSGVPAVAVSKEPVVEVRPKPAFPVSEKLETVVVAPVETPKPAAPVAPPAPAPVVAAPVVAKPVEPPAPIAAPPPPPPAAVAPAPPPAAPAPPVVPAETITSTAIAAATAAAVSAAPPRPPEVSVPPSENAETISYTAIAAATAAAVSAAPPAPPVKAEQAAKPVVAPVAEPAPAGESPRPAAVEHPAQEAGPADDLQRIRGIDSGLQVRLNQQGIVRFNQIADWTQSDVTRMSQSLGFAGRIEQENWIEQAQILAKGGETEFSRRRRLATATQPAAATAASAATATAAASAVASHLASQSAGPDRLTRIIGIDPEIEKSLNANGVTRFAEIARWSAADAERVERLIGKQGRILSDNWIDQAKVFARFGEGDTARPARLADAIRENADKPAASEAPAPRSDLSGLRSVRSEALRGDVLKPTGAADDLKRIRGVGVLIEKKLNSLGITTYEQVANWTGADIDRISQILDFKGRIERENWVEQARILASGGQTEFSRRVDRGEVDSSREPKV